MYYKPNLKVLMFFIIIVCFFQTSAFPDASQNIQKPFSRTNYVPGEVIIKYKENTRKSSKTVSYQNGITSIRKFKHSQCEHLRLPPDMTVEQAVETFSDDPEVLWVQPNYFRRQMTTIPNDTYIDQQWGLSQIDMFTVWDLETDCSNIIIAVIDSGIDYTHSDLEDNLWTNPGEIEDNNIDDDGNGLVDDIHGWNFANINTSYSGDNNIFDSNGHGSHVSGIIAAVGNNSRGVSGVCWTAQIMPLKFLNENGIGTSAAEVAAIEYAIDKGASIINASFGEEGYIYSERDAIEAAGSAGILFIAAAGNNGHNNDLSQDITGIPEDDHANYPASYMLDNIISVAASNSNDIIPYWSAYGQLAVDVTAPGVGIYSTYPGSRVTIWEDHFQSADDIAFWTFQDDAWFVANEEYYDGDTALSITPQLMSSSETSAITPVNNISGTTDIELDFYVSGNNSSASQKLFLDIGTSLSGPWKNQILIVEASDGSTKIYDQGVAGTNLSSGWNHIRSSLAVADAAANLLIRFRFLVGDDSGSSHDNGFCFINAAYANTLDSVWYIDTITLMGLDPLQAIPDYESLDGTSSAVPFVSGLAGLIWNRFPGLTHSQVRSAILQGVDLLSLPDQRNMIYSGGRVNATKIFNIADGF